MERIIPHTQPLVDDVRRLLHLEADAVARAANRLQAEPVALALRLMADSAGKVVVTGIGKSGIIAKKIAATMTSTGTPAVYLHPSDALHGDLGIVSADDVVLLLSNSGETDELLAMLPFLKHRRVPLIAITGNPASTLGRSASVALDASVEREACPFDLAPTTSTSVALALGDALAITLMQMKALTSADFALNHPAGRLGKRLTLRVKDLMHQGPVNPTIAPTAPWLAVIEALTAGGLGALNVVDAAGRLVGLITDGDLRRALQMRPIASLDDLTAAEMMAASPTTVAPEMLAYEAMQLMENRPSQISVLPVIDADRRSLGLIRLHDIVRGGLA
jgi:arabinose-5-phosphate isomerase